MDNETKTQVVGPTAPAVAAAESAGADGAARDFWTVPAGAGLKVPEKATATLVWQGPDGAEPASITYRAEAGHVDVRDDTGKLLCKMFYVSYAALGADGSADPDRPVTVLFNGGPGSASVPIDFGGFGPLRVQTDGMNHVRADAPTRDNPHTLLKNSDLVFFDAPGTGYSPVAAGVDPKAIFGADGDADAFCRAITAWLEENGRWSSPLYLLRNAVLMRLLGERGVKLTGVTMLSAIWDWVETLPGEDLYYLGMLPTMAAAAQYFGKAGEGVDVDAWFDRAMAFSTEVYGPALLFGDRLGAGREAELAEQISELIGLPVGFIRARHLRVSLEDFRTRVLEAEGKVCGRLDMRFLDQRGVGPCLPQLPPRPSGLRRACALLGQQLYEDRHQVELDPSGPRHPRGGRCSQLCDRPGLCAAPRPHDQALHPRRPLRRGDALLERGARHRLPVPVRRAQGPHRVPSLWLRPHGLYR